MVNPLLLLNKPTEPGKCQDVPEGQVTVGSKNNSRPLSFCRAEAAAHLSPGRGWLRNTLSLAPTVEGTSDSNQERQEKAGADYFPSRSDSIHGDKGRDGSFPCLLNRTPPESV